MNKINLFALSGRIGSGKDTAAEMLQYILDNPNSEYGDFCLKNPLEFYSYEYRKFADKLKDAICLLFGCTRKEIEDRTFKEQSMQDWFRFRVIDKKSKNKFYFSTKEQIELEKNIGGKLFGLNLTEPTLEPLTIRKMMQMLGTDFGRNQIVSDFWAKVLFVDYKPKEVIGGFKRNVKNHIGQVIDFETEVEYPKWIITDLRYPNDEGVIINKNFGKTIGVIRKFGLRFPEYSHLENLLCPYDVPYILNNEDPELYESLTFESESIMGNYNWCDYVIENNGTLGDLFEEVKRIVKSINHG